MMNSKDQIKKVLKIIALKESVENTGNSSDSLFI